MAVFVYENICDFCGKPYQPDQLAQLYGQPTFRFGFAAPNSPRIDICEDCQQRPIIEAVAMLAQDG